MQPLFSKRKLKTPVAPTETIEPVLDAENQDEPAKDEPAIVGICFRCNGNVLVGETDYYCDNCDFKFNINYFAKWGKGKLNEDAMRRLLKGDLIRLNNLVKKETGTTFSCFGGLAWLEKSEYWGVKFISNGSTLDGLLDIRDRFKMEFGDKPDDQDDDSEEDVVVRKKTSNRDSLMDVLDNFFARERGNREWAEFIDSDFTLEDKIEPVGLPSVKYTIGTPEKKCPKCRALMQRRIRSNGDMTEGQKSYFIAWDYCLECKYLQHYEKYKVKTTVGYQQALDRYLQARPAK